MPRKKGIRNEIRNKEKEMEKEMDKRNGMNMNTSWSQTTTTSFRCIKSSTTNCEMGFSTSRLINLNSLGSWYLVMIHCEWIYFTTITTMF